MRHLTDDRRFVLRRLDQCMVNLRDSWWPWGLFQKGTGPLVPRNTALENIAVRCDRSHEHAWIIGGKRSTAAGVWTVEFSESIISNALLEACLWGQQMRSALFTQWEVGEVLDQGARHAVAAGMYLRPEAIRLFVGPGFGGDSRILVRQIYVVLDGEGTLSGFMDRFLDGAPNAQEALATGAAEFRRNKGVPFVDEASALYTVEVYECAPYGVKAVAMPAKQVRRKTKRSTRRRSTRTSCRSSCARHMK